MANKADKFFFDNLVEAAECACRAANYLLQCLSSYDFSNIDAMLERMHALEHEADTRKHEMSSALAKAFVTPVDREDLAMLSQNIDEVVDEIEEVLQRFYVDQIRAIPADALVFAKRIVDCCGLMKQMLTEFVHFRKPERLHRMIVELNRMEEECDRLYLESTLNARRNGGDVLDILAWREIYTRMEDCADACEHVGDCVEMVVMKNT